MHGVGGWFSAELGEGIVLTNAPPNRALNWHHAFFPLETPLEVSAGDELRIVVSSAVNGSIWRWKVDRAGEGASVRGPAGDQSTLWGFPFSPERLAKRRADAAPALNPSGEVLACALGLLDGSNAVSGIEEQLYARFPGYFPHQRDAASFVRDLVVKYS